MLITGGAADGLEQAFNVLARSVRNGKGMCDHAMQYEAPYSLIHDDNT